MIADLSRSAERAIGYLRSLPNQHHPSLYPADQHGSGTEGKPVTLEAVEALLSAADPVGKEAGLDVVQNPIAGNLVRSALRVNTQGKLLTQYERLFMDGLRASIEMTFPEN